MKILLLDSSNTLSDLMQKYLSEYNLRVKAADDSEHALTLSYEETFDLYLFDLDTLNKQSLKLLENDQTPIIFMTSTINYENISLGFETYCEDFITKPFQLRELLLRIKSLQKRIYNSSNGTHVEISHDTIFDIEKEVIVKNSKVITLPNKELTALKYFLKKRDKIVTYEELFETLWDYRENISIDALRVHIGNLRQYIGTNIIKNIRNVGYRYTA